MPLEHLTAISSIDGRYRAGSAELAEHFSEFALIRNRVRVECEYLIALSETSGIGMRALSSDEKTLLRNLTNISVADAQRVKEIEKETNHDVKAVEYYIKNKLAETSLKDIAEWTHFALTSEDINSVAYGLSIQGALQSIVLPTLERVRTSLDSMAREYATTPMLARTHGQSASPTTYGKEIRVFEARLARQMQQLKDRTVLVKFSGATGNYNAHTVALPQVDWIALSKKLVARLNEGNTLHLELNTATTQIESHDTYAEMFDNVRRINTILIDLSADMWRYISDGWITQKPKAGEVGSSAMPHKVNPIDFENAEGNLGIANALSEHFSRKLPISRLQRDLSDSTVARTFGLAFAHAHIAYRSLLRGFEKIAVNDAAMLEALQAHPEVLAEAIQTVLRREGVEMPYEKLKELTRGKRITLEDLASFIDALDVPSGIKNQLRALRPETYTGIAAQIAKQPGL